MLSETLHDLHIDLSFNAEGEITFWPLNKDSDDLLNRYFRRWCDSIGIFCDRSIIIKPDQTHLGVRILVPHNNNEED